MRQIGIWRTGGDPPLFAQEALLGAASRFRETAFIVRHPQQGSIGVSFGGEWAETSSQSAFPLLAVLPALYPEWLGDRGFCRAHGLRFPYVGGAMANGIASTGMVVALAEAGCLGFFGAAGLSLQRIESAIHHLNASLGQERSWGMNLIHNPHEPATEAATVDLYIRLGVRRVSAAAYMKLTPALVRFACHGLRTDPQGSITRTHHVFAKVSHPEVARRFMEPAPAAMLDALVERGQLSQQEARLARLVPLAQDITVEADSGGHTDNRPLTALFPTILALRHEISRQHPLAASVRLGAGGGLGSPTALAAAFSLGAAYVLTGSVNQSCVESGLHPQGRHLLARARVSDVAMCPAADMFELGAEVQVLSRGTLFAPRARRLRALYRAHGSLDDLSPTDRTWLEQDILRASIQEAWSATRAWWLRRDPQQVQRAEADPHHQMALVMRAYLGQASRWAIAGLEERSMDHQIWCGPAMGAFNTWVAGSFLQDIQHRTVEQVARNLLEGAASVTRAQQLRSYGVPMPPTAFDFRPRLLR